MSYLSIHHKLEQHELMALGVLFLSFATAFVLMFVHPTASLFVFGVSLIFLVTVVIVGRFLVRAERAAARTELASGVCPKCGTAVEAETKGEPRHCRSCGADFLSSGIEQR